MGQTLRVILRNAVIRSITAILLLFCFGVGVSYGQTELINEGLRNGSLPDGWSQVDVSFQTTTGGYARLDEETSVLTTPSFDASTFATVEVETSVAKFGSGTDGPITIEYSLDGGNNWNNAGDTSIPTSSTYIDDTTVITSVSDDMVIRFTRPNSPSNKRLRDVVINGVGMEGTPVLVSSTETLSGFSYEKGDGPSNEQAFTIEGENLDGDITVTPPTNFEISESSGSGFTDSNITLTESGGSVTETTIYVRLKADLVIDWYNEIININGGGADPVDVSVSGSVNPDHEFLETFETENYNLTGSYGDGNFEGVTGVSWTYSESRDDAGYPINGNNAILLRGDDSPNYLSSLTSNEIEGGIDEFSVILRKGFTSSGNRQVALYIGPDSDNLELIATSNDFDIADELQRFTVTDINYVGDYVMRIQATTDNQVVIDDISWNSFEDGNIELTSNEGFRMLSLPVSGVDLAAFLNPIWTQGATGSDGPDFVPNVFKWDNTSGANDAWQAVTDLNTETPAAGAGFLVYVYEDDEYDENNLSNVVGGFPKTLSVSGAANSGDVTPAINSNADGFTLLGNPYSTTIDWDNIYNSNTNGLQDVIYVWDVNDGGSTENEAGLGSWKSYSSDGSGTGDFTDGLIAPFQGFFVKTVESPSTNPNLTFNSASEASSGGSLYGKQNESEHLIVRLELSGETMRSSSWLRFSENGSLENRVRGDAPKLQPLSERYAQLSTAKTGESLFDINHLPFPEKEYSVPVHINSTDGGSYTLTATDVELPADVELEFHDHARNVSVPINQDFEYSLHANPVKAKENLTVQEQLQNGPVAAKADNDEVRYSISVSKALTGEPGNPDSELPDHVALEQNYPNPFNPATVINYDIPEQSHVRLAVYDLIGRQVDLLVNETRAAGRYNITWDASQLSSGVYIYRLETAGQTLTRQMTLIK